VARSFGDQRYDRSPSQTNCEISVSNLWIVALLSGGPVRKRHTDRDVDRGRMYTANSTAAISCAHMLLTPGTALAGWQPVDECEHPFEVALSEVANALQAASLLVALERRQGTLSPGGTGIETAINRATTAVRQLRPEVRAFRAA
jgi:hypothetical protein